MWPANRRVILPALSTLSCLTRLSSVTSGCGLALGSVVYAWWGVCRPSALWGRSWLYQWRNSSRSFCMSLTVFAGGRARSRFFSVWWKRSIFPWVWGCPARPFFCRMLCFSRNFSKPFLPPLAPASRAVKTRPLSVRVDWGEAVFFGDGFGGCDHGGASYTLIGA